MNVSKEILRANPGPWRQVQHGNQIMLVDAHGAVVQLFTMIALAIHASTPAAEKVSVPG